MLKEQDAGDTGRQLPGLEKGVGESIEADRGVHASRQCASELRRGEWTRAVSCLLFSTFASSSHRLMGRNRKWVLEDHLQDAVWKTILRGPRPPSVRWEKPRNQSAAAKSQEGSKRNQRPGTTEAKKKDSPQVAVSTKKQDSPQVAPPRRESISPDALQAAARVRVSKLEAIITTLGEDDEAAPILQEALRKARAQAQELPLSERVESTRMYVERQQKRVERARLSATKARDALTEALAHEKKEEALLTEAEERLSQLRVALKDIPSPFTVPIPPVVPDLSHDMHRMQRVIDELQRELTRLRTVPAHQQMSATPRDDDPMEFAGTHQPSAGAIMNGLIDDAMRNAQDWQLGAVFHRPPLHRERETRRFVPSRSVE